MQRRTLKDWTMNHLRTWGKFGFSLYDTSDLPSACDRAWSWNYSETVKTFAMSISLEIILLSYISYSVYHNKINCSKSFDWMRFYILYLNNILKNLYLLDGNIVIKILKVFYRLFFRIPGINFLEFCRENIDTEELEVKLYLVCEIDA